MKILLWTVSAVVALIFLAVGAMKLLTPAADLAQSSPDIPVTVLRIAGLAEVLGALGLILPAATRILPILTPAAAIGLSITMAAAIVINLINGAYAGVALAAILLIPSLWIAKARLGTHAVTPRTAEVTTAGA